MTRPWPTLARRKSYWTLVSNHRAWMAHLPERHSIVSKLQCIPHSTTASRLHILDLAKRRCIRLLQTGPLLIRLSSFLDPAGLLEWILFAGQLPGVSYML